MSLAATLPSVVLETLLGHLALLFLTGAHGDLVAAHQAARQMLAAYHPETEDELRLVAEIVSFSFHAIEALGQAATPDMPLTKILRLRGSAVSLSREAHKSQRKLDQLQRDRHAGLSATQADPTAQSTDAAPPATDTPPRPRIDKALDLIETTREAISAAGNGGAKTWTQAYQQRLAARRIAENLKKNQIRQQAAECIAAAGAINGLPPDVVQPPKT